MAFPKVGNLAPKFSLQDHEDKTVALADFKGKSSVVVYFYPKAMTPGCTIQAQAERIPLAQACVTDRVPGCSAKLAIGM